MGGEFDRPDRFGCGEIAMALFAGLLMVALAFLAVGVSDPNFRQIVEEFLRVNQAAQEHGPGDGNGVVDQPIPGVSDRFFSAGDATTTVTGDLQLTGRVEIDTIASYAQDGLAWISFRDGGDTEILVAFNEPEDSVTVAQGDLAAIGQDDACNFDIEVTATLVSGSISCPSVDLYRDGEPAGNATIELTFSAAS